MTFLAAATHIPSVPLTTLEVDHTGLFFFFFNKEQIQTVLPVWFSLLVLQPRPVYLCLSPRPRTEVIKPEVPEYLEVVQPQVYNHKELNSAINNNSYEQEMDLPLQAGSRQERSLPTPWF